MSVSCADGVVQVCCEEWESLRSDDPGARRWGYLVTRAQSDFRLSGANPKFSFLRDKGEGSEYFRWRLYCLQMKFEKVSCGCVAVVSACELE
eukprot:760392-Hanusia_phi.AAC.3